jgi:carboxymethylenebutenolidase
MSELAGAVADPQALRTADVTFESDGASIEAYVARPSTPGSYPGLIVIHEAFGPVEHIRDVARRFANVGYVVIAPNLYSREGQPAGGDMDDLMAKMFGQDDHQAVRDLEAAAAWLRADEESTGKVGVIGFCSGARMTLLFASSSDAPDAAIYCWGGFIQTATPDERVTSSRPTAVIDLVDGLSCPVLVVAGAEDDNPSPEDIAALTERLQAAGKDSRTRVFEGAGHAFFADYRPSYVESAAHELWPLLTATFDRHLR